MFKTYAFKLFGPFGPFIVPGFGRDVEEARKNLTREMKKDPMSFCPECIKAFDTLEEFHAAEDSGEFRLDKLVNVS